MEDPYDANEITHYVLHCHIGSHGRPRYDWVVFPKTRLEDKDRELPGIKRFEIGQLRLLFELTHNFQIFQLAYIQMFHLPWGGIEPYTQLQIAMRTNNYKIIPVSTIIRHVHLIPYFMRVNTALKAHHNNSDVYSFPGYLVNKYCDRYSWENFR